MRSMNSQSAAMVKSTLTHAVCGITDPFCRHAIGAKYPDFSPIRTIPYSYRGMTTMTSASDGAQLWMWHPSFSYQPFTQVEARSGSTAISWINFGTFAPIAGITQYRIVSSGFTLKRICAPLTTSGTLSIRSWPSAEGSSLTVVDGLSYSASTTVDIPIQDCKEVAFITNHSTRRPEHLVDESSDEPSVGLFRDNGFCPATVFISGAPISTAIFSIQIVIHYEIVLEDSSNLAQLATLPPPANEALTSAAAKVTSSAKSIFSNGVKAASDYVVKKAGVAVASYFGGPIGAMSAAITVD